MLRRATRFIERHATGRTILASLALSVVLGVLPLNYALTRIRTASPDAVPLDVMMSYTPDQAYAMIASYGADARSYYVFNAFTADVVGPALFGLTIALMASALLRRLTGAGSRWHAAAVIGAVAALVVDVIENALLSVLVVRFPERLDTVAELANVATIVKRTMIFGTWALVLGAALVLVVRTLVKASGRGSPG